jgi:hypothetical protein
MIDPVLPDFTIDPARADAMAAFLRRNADKIVPLPTFFDPPCGPLPIAINLHTGEVTK